MVEEKNILIHINETIYNFLLTLNETKSSISEIKNDINDLNNNYFLEDKYNIYGKLLNLFDEEVLFDLMNELQNFQNQISLKIDNCCNHDWVEDLIDINHDKSQIVSYCKKCEVSKKY
jgi:hypothetical protein